MIWCGCNSTHKPSRSRLSLQKWSGRCWRKFAYWCCDAQATEAGAEAGHYMPAEAGAEAGHYMPAEAGAEAGHCMPTEAGTEAGHGTPAEAGH